MFSALQCWADGRLAYLVPHSKIKTQHREPDQTSKSCRGAPATPLATLRSIPMLSATIPDPDFFHARPGLKLKNARYEVLRKLGTGVYSSTWLISDTEPE